jgi:peptidoglycan/xylan/chitin deacetylase (PgdA/CDA1 family)
MTRSLATGLAALCVLSCGCGAARSGSTRRAARRASPAAPGASSSGERPRQLAREQRAIDHVLRYTDYISVGAKRRMDVALTFDDGPGPDTPRLLALLRADHVPATFFQIGRSVRLYPQTARRELRDGYPIGDHTATHPFLTQLPARAQRRQILDAAGTIATYGAPYPRLFRPPYGAFNEATLAVLRAQRLLMVLWTVDTKDFSRPGVRRIVSAALGGVGPGAIILMHDGGGPRGQTIAALPRIIRGLRRRHFHLVSVPRLIADDPPPRSQPPPRSLSGH